MRDRRFVAVHRGGGLTKENHSLLMGWARACALHVWPLLKEPIDERLREALDVAKAWEAGNVPTGAAMKASVAAHAAARALTEQVSVAVARSIGQAVATAHMADHSMGAALYALKAVNLSGGSVDEERAWQIKALQRLPSPIVELVLTTMTLKSKSFKLS